MIKVQVKSEDISVLAQGRYEYPHPRVIQRMEALILKSKGFTNEQICQTLDIYPNTLRKAFRMYMERGISQLKELHFYHSQSDLKAYSGLIEDYFKKNPPRSISEAAEKIRELTGIERKETRVRKFLKDLNFKFIKVGSVPAKAQTEEKKEQRDFLEKSIKPRLAEVKEGKRVVLFADAAHFVCSSVLGCLWCIVRFFVPTMSGRQRYNVLGAINAITNDFHTVCNDTYINSLSVCELLKKIGEIYAGKVVTVILDNAKYQRCKLGTELSENLTIKLFFLPSYSPNLNLIERLWKWTKKNCLNCRYYKSFKFLNN